MLLQLIMTGLFGLCGILLGHFLGKRKTKADTTKVEADTLKSLADVYNIKISADLQIAQQWQKIADEIRTELDKERRECDARLQIMQKMIDDLKKEIELLKPKT